MKKILLLTLLWSLTMNSLAQVTIQMQRQEDGTFIIPGKVNGLDLKFIFDTGASNVCISSAEAVFMLKNGYLNESDIKGSSYSQIANGDIIENTKIVLRNVQVGGVSISNVDALVVHNLNAPLLFGQSAIQKLGPIQLDGNKLIIKNGRDFKSDDEAENLSKKAYQDIQSHKYNEAIAASLKAVSMTNNKSILMILYEILAQAYSGLGDLPKAIDACDKGLGLNPSDNYMAYNRAVFLFDNNQMDMAEEAFTIFSRNMQGNTRIPQHMIFGTYTYLGLIKSSKGQYPASEQFFLKAIANSPDTTNINMLSTYRGLADLYGIQDKNDKAIIYYKKATELNPNDISNIEYYCNLADCYNATSDYANAITTYTNCLNLFYGKYYKAIQGVIKEGVQEYIQDANKYMYYGSMATRNLSRLYCTFLAFDKAIPGYELIWDLEPMQHFIECRDYVYLSEAYFAKEDIVSANKILNQGLIKFPNNPDLLFTKAFNNKDNNISIYTEIIRQENNYKPFRFDYATAYNNLAWAYYLNGDSSKALPFSLKSVQKNPEHDYSWETLGEIYFSLGKYQDCINAMTKCIELNSKAKNAYEFRGKAYLQLGKKKDGEKDLRISETLQ